MEETRKVVLDVEEIRRIVKEESRRKDMEVLLQLNREDVGGVFVMEGEESGVIDPF